MPGARCMKMGALLALSLSTSACGLFGVSGGAAPRAAPNRGGEAEMWDRSAASDDEELGDVRKTVEGAMRLAVGKRKGAPPLPEPYPAEQSITALRKSPIKLKVVPTKSLDGEPIDNFMRLEDSFTTMMTRLSRKVAEQRATPAEQAMIQSQSKYMIKVSDLRMQINAAASATLETSMLLERLGVALVSNAVVTVRLRRQSGTQVDDADRERLRQTMLRLRRAEALAAASTALMASYQASINDGKAPKAITAVSQSMLKGLAEEPTVEMTEVDALLDDLPDRASKMRAAREAALRERFGDEEYERAWKSGVDALFDLEPVGGARPAPTTGSWTPRGATASFRTDLLPDGPVRSSLEAVDALRRGDPGAAIRSAIDLVPGGGLLNDGLSLASDLLFGS